MNSIQFDTIFKYSKRIPLKWLNFGDNSFDCYFVNVENVI